jgi:hypothetical protein
MALNGFVLTFEHRQLLNFDFDACPDPDLAFDFDVDPDTAFHSDTVPIRIRLPKMMRIRIRYTVGNEMFLSYLTKAYMYRFYPEGSLRVL